MLIERRLSLSLLRSVYISIEFVRTAQAAFIYGDNDMYDTRSDTRTLARSWNLSDECALTLSLPLPERR